jgi:SAM-dependent methyltransferase
MTTTRTDYERLAQTYDRRYADETYAPVERYLVARAGGRRVLEVGCGTGHWLEVLAAHGARAFGVDPSGAMLAFARRRGPVARGRAEALPFAPASFDAVIAVNAHHHFADPRAFAGEARRVLAPGGTLTTIALDPHTCRDRWWIYDCFPGTLEHDRARYPATAVLRVWLSEAGFADVASEVILHDPETIPVRDAVARGRSWTSQLAVLDDDAWARGVERMQALGDEGELAGDLRLWSTTARAE